MDEWLPFISDKLKRYIVLVLSALGLLISIFIRLYIEDQNSSVLACKVTGLPFLNCESVINSAYGKVFGIHLSLIGAFYFICLLAVYGVDYRNDFVTAALALAGILSVFDFLFIEFFLVNHFCLYCTSIHIIVVIIFILIGPPAIVHSYQDLREKYLTK